MVADTLESGLDALGLTFEPAAIDCLRQYLALLAQWNRVYNLTAIREPERMVTEHVLDSLAVLRHLHGTRLLDVGTGAGLPGIPLAVARPDWRVTLLDSSRKKTAFVRQVAIELGLRNAEVVCARAEQFRPDEPYDTVISRALSDIAAFARLAGAHVAADGILAAMKGVYPHEELRALPSGFRLSEVVELKVPGLSAKRHLVVMTKA